MTKMGHFLIFPQPKSHKMSDPTHQLQNITPSIGPYRFRYPDNGLAVYRINSFVEQYLYCDEYLWWQVLRVGKKKFKAQVFLHTKEEQQTKVWKKFRGMERVDSMYFVLTGYAPFVINTVYNYIQILTNTGPLNDFIHTKKQTVGQFRLVWMSKADLVQAVQILKKQKDEDGQYRLLIETLETAIEQKQEDDVPQTSSFW